jgi:PHD/YefM family antitoxin component YafN of YafNO toxin-antitoxin module
MSANEVSEMIHETQPAYATAAARWPDEPLIVERSGRPTAVIISLEEYRRFAAWREERAARRAWVQTRDLRNRAANEQWHAQFVAMDRFATHFEDISDAELADELTQAIAAVRADRAR